MHFIIGGAYHGKKQWVKDELNRTKKSVEKVIDWSPEKSLEGLQQDVLVWYSMENWVLHQCHGPLQDDEIVEAFKNWIDQLDLWEKKKQTRSVMLVGTDQSKGIVPLDQTMRRARDLSGWCFQHSAQISSRVTRVWYGIGEELKQEEEE
ncbi:bifunctional adenosylcobinamide kinase/adenosylcobinamide-phosphate guanylyltransferase [Jeotgalibacillus sp. ET6]|uniref:bifunctional adenosylcobinamide kinase/adenosylcobinamide-phosphate guanylyltransferase n=1 Tax=Jeotgalibacillus sp. ET6 TaxID=3037260 RepID=UPI0024185D4C|nr:bifunctional adenosylcobinamide kinase/adenosylcobinamide-phosphate guanylyltransferase [Jeotgalibacillus sp. ET6]MDG5471141.1 bifunctional adenosylcobinamide kinase/adenosylcobinamide-phosphate guanylyltransferase [Jeotgalibacillus sp. ET6]